MKKLISLLILTTLVNITYGSFPIASNSEIEAVNELNVGSLTNSSRTPVFGILSITFGLGSLLLYLAGFIFNNLGMFSLGWLLGIFALIFGVIGLFKSKSKRLAIIGSILGILESIALILFIIIIGTSGGN